MLTLPVSVLVILLMAALGWKHGVVRLGSSLLVLVVASLLAEPLAPLSRWLVEGLGAPKLMLSLLSTLASGLIVFIALIIPTSVLIKRKLSNPEEKLVAWDRAMGSLLGGVWGMIIVLFTLTALSSVARLDRAMRQGVAEADMRQQARVRFEREVEAELRPLRTTMTRKTYLDEKEKMVAEREASYQLDKVALLQATAQGPMDGFLVDLEYSPFEAVVEKVSPVNEKVETTLRDLTIVMSDSMLTARFLEEPDVKALINDPVVQGLSKDPEIARAIAEKRYRELMDNAKIVALLDEPQVRQKFSRLDIAGVLARVRAHDWRPPVDRFRS